MQVSPTEAEAALEAIETVARRTRQSLSSTGTFMTMVITGTIWLIGFTCTQFLPPPLIGYIWAGLSGLGCILGVVFGVRMGSRHRSEQTPVMAKRVGIFWLLLILFAVAFFAVASPIDGKQATMFVILFNLLGQMGMGLLFSFSAVWWTIPITILALIGYFFFSGIFYLWIAILGGGGMIALGFYIRSRW
jgi:hypothetical protein